MSATCGCDYEPATESNTESDKTARRWWQDRGIMVPVFSGVAFLIGLALEASGKEVPGLVAFWIGLVLGASTFTPGAIRKLLRGKLGIGLLMTISAVGAVILGYVEEAAALAFLYSIAEALEDKAMDRARGGLRALLALVPETATIRQDGASIEIPASDLTTGQRMLVRPGERIATDGVIRVGQSSLNTSAITGESIPVAVEPGDAVSAGAINISGALEVETTAAGSDNSLTTIVTLVEQAQTHKGNRARLADRLARPLVPGVLVLAALVAVFGIFSGDPELWITRALVVLVAASPCALAISVPLTVVAAIGAASKFGVIIKSGAAFERFGAVRHVAVDKTGTLTRNDPAVTAVLTTDGVSETQALAWAGALEQHSTHPLATAITAAAHEIPMAESVTEHAGQGVAGTVDDAQISVGSPRWFDAGSLGTQVADLESQGMTVVIVHRNSLPVAAIGVRDELRTEAHEAVHALTSHGIGMTMLTGDNARTARALGEQAGITDVRAELRPEDKAAAIIELGKRGTIAMIGDGINDTPALAAADVGIAMGIAGSDAAIDSADVVFTGHDLRLLPRAFNHARRARGIINQNIVLSLLIITILLPLALFGILNLAEVVLVHEVAELVVILNALRSARSQKLGTLARNHRDN